MKKNLLLVLFTFLSITAFSQVTWNAKVGINFSNYTEDDDMNNKVGFKIGGGFECRLAKVLSLQPSLLLSTKGAKYEGLKINSVYIELPIMLAARIAASEDTNFVFSAGPYLAYGVGGNTSYNDIKIDTFSEHFLQPFDAGIGCGIAAELGKIVVGIEAQAGLVDVLKIAKSKNTNLSVNLGYKF